MDTVVFFNAQGKEYRIWQQLTGASLPSRNIEGARLAMRSPCEPPHTGGHACTVSGLMRSHSLAQGPSWLPLMAGQHVSTLTVRALATTSTPSASGRWCMQSGLFSWRMHHSHRAAAATAQVPASLAGGPEPEQKGPVGAPPAGLGTTPRSFPRAAWWL